MCRCEISDLTLGERYFAAEGGSESEALEAAIEGALTAPKPRTPAQQYAEQMASADASLDSKDAEIRRLEGELAAAQAGKAEKPKPKRRVPTDPDDDNADND